MIMSHSSLVSCVFPTHVGVNRYYKEHNVAVRSIPLTRGGEPAWLMLLYIGGLVFPTHVGVNRVGLFGYKETGMYSPHTWG